MSFFPFTNFEFWSFCSCTYLRTLAMTWLDLTCPNFSLPELYLNAFNSVRSFDSYCYSSFFPFCFFSSVKSTFLLIYKSKYRREKKTFFFSLLENFCCFYYSANFFYKLVVFYLAVRCKDESTEYCRILARKMKWNLQDALPVSLYLLTAHLSHSISRFKSAYTQKTERRNVLFII